MPNALYNSGKQALLRGELNLQDSAIAAALVSIGYSFDANLHTNTTSITAHILGTPQVLTAKTTANGVFDAADITYLALTAGAQARAVVLYRDTGVAATSTLVAFIDTISGFPLATNGGDVTIQWDNGAFRIFSL